MVKIRLKRVGRRHQTYFRIAVCDIRAQRDGVSIEELGFYNPLTPNKDEVVTLKNPERVKYWIEQGAQPSATVVSLLKRMGINFKQVQAARDLATAKKKKAKRLKSFAKLSDEQKKTRSEGKKARRDKKAEATKKRKSVKRAKVRAKKAEGEKTA